MWEGRCHAEAALKYKPHYMEQPLQPATPTAHGAYHCTLAPLCSGTLRSDMIHPAGKLTNKDLVRRTNYSNKNVFLRIRSALDGSAEVHASGVTACTCAGCTHMCWGEAGMGAMLRAALALC